MIDIDDIEKLTRRLYPKGRAFKFPEFGIADRLNRGLSLLEVEAYNDAISILDSILPDNPNFNEDDATAWEKRLGIITNTSLTLEQRKQALIRKINHPGTIKPRQARIYIESQLRDAGFDVYVYENIPEQDPVDVMANALGNTGQYGTYAYGEQSYGSGLDIAIDTLITPIEYGQFQMGQGVYGGNYNNKVMNYLDSDLDLFQDQGENFRASFFIGGDPIGTFADVDASRETEFRQLILKLKPTHTVAFLFVNFV